MNSFVNLIIEDNKFFYAAISFLFFFFYLLQYIYIFYNLKGICRIIFSDESHFTLPLEPFNCFFISVLPIVFWREMLNIKKNLQIKRLYWCWHCRRCGRWSNSRRNLWSRITYMFWYWYPHWWCNWEDCCISTGRCI